MVCVAVNTRHPSYLSGAQDGRRCQYSPDGRRCQYLERGCFHVVLNLAFCWNSDSEGVFRAQFKQQLPIVNTVADSVPSWYSWPNVSTNPCVEIVQNEDLLCVFRLLYDECQFTVEGFLGCRVCL